VLELSESASSGKVGAAWLRPFADPKAVMIKSKRLLDHVSQSVRVLGAGRVKMLAESTETVQAWASRTSRIIAEYCANRG
jgi:hypothetical protein